MRIEIREIFNAISVTFLLFAISAYIPFIGFVCSFFIPFPIIYYHAKLGRQNAIIVVSALLIAITVAFGCLGVDFLFFLTLISLGFILGEAINLKFSIEKTILYSCGYILAAGIFILLIYSGIVSDSLTSKVSEYINKNLQLTLDIYKNIGISEEKVQLLYKSINSIHYILVRILPGLIISAMLFISWLNLIVAKKIFIQKKLLYPDFGQLNLWKTPENLVWGVVLCGILLILIPEKGLKLIGLNGLIILSVIYFFQGMAVISFYFESKKFPQPMKIFLYSLIAVQQFLILLVVGLGLFDMWFNFRKISN